MISRWLDGDPLPQFLSDHFQKAPLAKAAAARDSIALLTWDTIARLVDGSPQPDTLVVRNGKLLPNAEPRSLREAQSLFGAGCSIVMRRLERHDEALKTLADAISAELEGTVSIQAYATPAEFSSFGWHYDCEDVFIVQTAGTKEYFLRENTINPAPHIERMPRDMQYETETSTTKFACTLAPGDLLYVPTGWWHRARALDDALSISVGVLTPGAGGEAQSQSLTVAESQRSSAERQPLP
jgi:50S ribosomal protein L16 3-hydroxylase